MRSCLSLSLLLSLGVVAQAKAQSFDGRYKLTPEADCTILSDDDTGFLRIENGMLYGAESRCEMTNPLDIRDMEGYLYDMQCVGEGAAEGTVWRERAIVVRGAEGELILVWDGFAFAYPRCPGPTLRPMPRPVGSAPG